ncbi:MAG: TlyA family RNA methyltransferase [Acidobacteriota bacterium]|nr:TlyA family RNA methyltransferase [Acidobacteriota bacterium]
MKERADITVVKHGLAESRQKAQALIMAGLVFSEDRRIEKPGQMMSPGQEIYLKEKLPYVGRGGLKLAEALEKMNINVMGKTAADLGSSTGGFTDCLLQKGANKVYAVDVDTRQIDYRLRKDSRVILIEKNARYLEKRDFSDSLDIVTMDLSFISVLKVLPAVKGFLGNGELISLIKPQFEVGKKGIVRNPALHEEVLNRIIIAAGKIGFNMKKLIKTSVRGQKGNQEFFILWSLKEKPLSPARASEAIKETVWNEKN